ncbi:MAG TPA: FliH/SctL family protein [Polyangiaceae bacterium]|nr:FliH/SctL family protein [Polyangiaceae bacterium]
MADSRHPAARRAQFTDVSPERPLKKPRWLSPRESTLPPPPAPAPSEPRHSRPESPSLRPAAIPKEFVQAMKKELRVMPTAPPAPHEVARGLAETATLADQMARVLRPSELPPPPEPKADPGLERAFQSAVEEMALARTRILEAAGSQLASLAVVIARRVIARELSLAPEILEDLVREGLEALAEQHKVRVRVGRGFVNAVDGLERNLGQRGSEFRVFVEDSLDDYACVVETELGQVDESVEKRLEKLLEALKPDSETP